MFYLNYDYGTTQNNGNVLSQTITVPSVTVGGTTHNGFTAVQNYTYDALNRLDDAAEYIDGNPIPSWRQDFSYDRYGNRNFDEANTTFAGFEKLCNNNTELCAELRKIMNPSVNTSDNRLSSSDDYVFDTSGNTTEDAQGRTFIYDAENKQVEVRDAQQNIIGQYRYDGDGKRIKKHVPSTGEVTVFVYDAGAKMIGEYSTIAAPQSPKVSYTTADHLGSPRILTDENGATISRRDFHPFGEEISTPERTVVHGYQNDAVRQKFTGYERDEETGLDFAEARYYYNNHGRFTAVDPLLASGKSADPQTFNRYAYTMNRPLVLTDPLGLQAGSKYLVPCENGAACEYSLLQNETVVRVNTRSLDSTTVNLEDFREQIAIETATAEVSSAIYMPPVGHGFEEQAGAELQEIGSQAATVIRTVAPDYGKVQASLPMIGNVEVTITQDFSVFVGGGVSRGSGDLPSFMEMVRSGNPRAGLSANLGWFTTRLMNTEQRNDAVGGTNITGSLTIPSMVSLGLSQSIPKDGSSVMLAPRAIEIGTPSSGGVSIAESIMLVNGRDFLRWR